MVRTQIQLTEEQARELRRIAVAEGASISAVVRRLIDLGLRGTEVDRPSRWATAANLVGRFSDRSQAKDLAADHDRYLDEAYR